MTPRQTPGSDSDVEVARLIRAAGSRPAPDAGRAARVRAAVEREWRAQARRRRMRRLLKLTGGGVALIAAIATVFVAVRQRSSVTPPAMPPAATPIASVAAAHGAVTTEIAGARTAAAAVGQTIAAGSNIRTNGTSRATVTLADGGELRIDADTTVTLVDARTIHLERGAIYLDSGASTPGSFTVRTASGTVRDIGTRFEVRAGLLRQGSGGRGDRDLRVPLSIKVRDGAVQLERAGRIDRAAKGTALLAAADGTVSTRSIDPFAADWAWTREAAPPFIVENATLEAFLQWVAREGGWTIEWSDALRQRARTTTLHGTIDGMTPAEALDAMLPTCGLSPAVVNGRLRLRPIQVMR
jgi:ferric-dicitrate binding protein FerR (iron transport regulator)